MYNHIKRIEINYRYMVTINMNGQKKQYFVECLNEQEAKEAFPENLWPSITSIKLATLQLNRNNA